MTVFLTGVLNFLQAYGYPALGITMFAAAFGVPLPAGPMLLAAGAFAAQGDFNVAILTGIATGASVGGDCTGYVVGRLWGSKLLDWLPRSRVGRRFIKPQTTHRSRLYFRRHGAWAVFLTRFLLVWLGSITNLVAGTELYPFRTFLLWDVIGEVLGAVIPLTLGFVVGASWETASNMLGTISLFVLGLLSVVVLAYSFLRHLKRAAAVGHQEQLQVGETQPARHKEE
jgi:membrane-associated protein